MTNHPDPDRRAPQFETGAGTMETTTTGGNEMNTTTKKYTADGVRLTDCCGAYSTFVDVGDGWELSCKQCYKAVPSGQGDGSETK